LAVEITRQTLTLAGTTSITVSDIAADEVNGGFVRKVLFYTDPLDSVNRRPDIELTLTADSKDSLEIQTPQLEF